MESYYKRRGRVLDQSWVILVKPVKREAVAVAATPDGKWVVHLTTIFGQLSCPKQ